ncbi:hypothetical protein CLAFUW4_08863 [Fulvia fulva]|uniref:Uncharacterized protein n=1 Tax=Passalora fulva TaxID=5499 RepID=A0A9Q8PFP0_PASFU|nr:uncharacterized protein CLAFUR5_08969 [Fulvia fulva]KAK4613547.1 hypothetical protein CLAFUR4_08869 [Fulvia fulva]KAK4614441.1 hypothetical protein CLAFUR0_08861 [Fulvia fulva]UJO21628.1 hypothetical protein CLAFUR5_08969 [Fulvia fulva]WPV20741.1 hypothetical protein CLAFUW4_08863 [Fulvia fulva]WPV34969.1 hypothetical protein CLAFUW7_08864 [Fulvia fulva]
MGLLDKLRAKYDIYKLEQRYTQRNKRTTFCSNAIYVDGEYQYQPSPTSMKSSTSSFGSSNSKTGSNRKSRIIF